MEMEINCPHCNVRIKFKKGDIKEKEFCKEGDIFKKSEAVYYDKYKDKLKAYWKDTYQCEESLKINCVECPNCSTINWLNNTPPLAIPLIDVKENGWWLCEHGYLKARKIKDGKKTHYKRFTWK